MELARVRQLRSPYDTRQDPQLPLGFGDYLSLLFRLDEQSTLLQERGEVDPLLLRRAWYLACCSALCRALALQGTAFDTLHEAKPYDPRQIVAGLRPSLRAQHGPFQAVYYEIALGGLLRQRADVLRMGRSVTHLRGGPGSGIADKALQARIHDVYFTRFDEGLLNFSRHLLDIDRLLEDLLPLDIGPPVELARLRSEFGFPDRADARWRMAFSLLT